MDKYARQSHKTNQRARRRNNTAQYLLENQLKQLDKERRWGQVTFQRNLNRVKSELSNFGGVSSDFSLPLDDDLKRSKNADPDFLHLDNTQQWNSNNDGSEAFFDSLREQTVPGKIRNISSINSTSVDNIDGLSNKNNKDNNNNNNKNNNNNDNDDDDDYDDYDDNDNIERSSFLFLSSSTPTYSFLASLKDPTKDFPGTRPTIPRTSTAKRHNSLAPCEYNDYLNNRLPLNCNHFPCKLPQTYHTLGFRRDDLCPQTEGSDISKLTLNQSTVCLSLEDKDNLKASTESLGNGRCPRKTESKNSPRFNTNWIKTYREPAQKFNPTIQGPIFGYRPADPVLERIREHRKEPILNATRPCARITIRDRIRGVKQLVKEMKMSNERVKPEDWSTNYGKRVPTRVLLNPVVPV